MKYNIPKCFLKIPKKVALVSAFALIGGVAFAQFPAPYCNVAFPTGKEPITLVEIATISNESPATTSGALDLEDFTSITGGDVVAGSSYPMVVKGYTGGNYTNKIKVFIDWNQNGEFESDESYELSDIVNSTGLDNKESTGTIDVPSTAINGETRMRVTKKFSSFATACNTGGFGQAEDYTLTVTGGQAPPTCFPPTSLTVSNIGPFEATVAWTEASVVPGSGYEYFYNTTGDAPSASTPDSGSVAAGILTVDLTDLEPSTIYHVWTRSVCDANDLSAWSSSVSFTTLCAPFATPYLEDFDSGVPGECWSRNKGWLGNPVDFLDENGTWTSANWMSTATISDKAAQINLYYNSRRDWLISPQIDIGNDGDHQLEFDISIMDWSSWEQMNLGSDDTVAVLISEDGGDTWSDADILKLWTEDNTPFTNGSKVIIPLTAYSGVVQFAFYGSEGEEDDSEDNRIQINNFLVREMPACQEPISLTLDAIDESSAELTWEAPTGLSSGGYEYFYNTTGEDPVASTPDSGSVGAGVLTADLTDLDPLTTYYVWVRSVCGNDGNSEWSNGASFTTLPQPQTPAVLPWEEDFTSGGDDWTILNGSETNQWYIGNATGNSGNSLYISNDEGVTHAYTTSGAASVVHAYRDIQFPATSNDFLLSFDWKGIGEGFSSFNYDYLRVWMVPASFLPNPGTQIAASSDGENLFGNMNNQEDWEMKSLEIPNALVAGETVRLVFEWRNDGGSGSQPPAGIDNIVISELTCGAPSDIEIDNFTLTSADISWEENGTSTSWIVEYGPSGFTPGTGTTESISTTPSASLSGLTAQTAYDVYVKSICGTDDESLLTGPETFVTGYCQPIYTSTSDYTKEFSTDGGFTNIDYAVTSQPSNGYEDATSMIVSKEAGGSFGITTLYVGGSNTIVVWIDWNNDLIFDSSEEVYNEYSSSVSQDGIITIPAGTANGEYIMRVRSRFSTTVPTPCSSESWGSAIDFTLSVEDIPCDDPVIDLDATATLCEGSTITLNAGNAGLDFEWSDGSTSQTLIVDEGGTYSVTVTDGNCSSEAEILVTVQGLPIVDLGNDTTICEGESLTLDAGNAGLDFEWSDASTGQTLEVDEAGIYSVAVSENGCSASSEIEVSIQELPIVDLGGDVSVCEGETFILDAGNAGMNFEWNDGSSEQTLEIDQAGTYSVTVFEGECAASDTVEVEVDPLPSATNIVIVDLGNGAFDFSVEDASDVESFDWVFGDGNTASGETVSNTYTESGSYEVVLTISNDCGEQTLTTTVETTVGIKNVDVASHLLKLYPNPAKNNVIIENNSGMKMEQVTVFNILGQVVYQTEQLLTEKYQMNVSNLSSGLYTVRIKTNEGFVMRKFEILK